MANDTAQQLKDSFSDAVTLKPQREAVSNAIGSAVDKAKNFLGIHSTPSSSSDSSTSWHDDMVSKANDSFKKAAQTPAPKSTPTTAPKYHKGTDFVPKTGPAILKKGEAVLNVKDAEKHREAKGMAEHKNYDVSDELGGKKEEKPKKEIDHIKTKKAKTGGYVHTHVHTRPEHHPDETHVSATQDDMANHMMQSLGEPNPGEAEADAGQSGVPAAQPGAAAAGGPPAAGPTQGM